MTSRTLDDRPGPPPGLSKTPAELLEAAARARKERLAVRAAVASPRETGDFGDQLYAALRQSSWVALSLVVHLVALGILSLVDLGLRMPSPVEKVEYGLAQSVADADPGLREDLEDVEEEDLLESLDRVDPVFQDALATAINDLVIEPTPEEPEDFQPFEPHARDGLQDAADAVIGLAPSARTGVELSAGFGKSGAKEANQQASDAVRRNPFARRLLEGVRRHSNATSVRVLKGDYDSCEDVLGNLALPYSVLDPADLREGMVGPDVKILLYNCTPKPLTEPAVRHLERWVYGGGYLFTTDWGIETVLDRVFPEYVRSYRKRSRPVMTDDEVVEVRTSKEHALLSGVPETDQVSRWWLEDSTLLIDIKDRRKVETLLWSPDLEHRYGPKPVAITFQHGRGRVVHLLGHLYQKEGNLRGTYAIQRILLNFMREALRRK